MSASTGGTVGYFPRQNIAGSAGYEFRTPTESEVIEINKKMEEDRLARVVLGPPKPFLAPNGVTWVSEGAYEQGVKLDKALKQIRELEAELLLEKGKGLSVPNVSGEYEETSDHNSPTYLDIWPASTKGWPHRTRLIKSKCDFCASETHVLEMDNSSGEYSFHSICQTCLNSAFDAFWKKVAG